jgi:hypothetical protein
MTDPTGAPGTLDIATLRHLVASALGADLAIAALADFRL